MLALVRESAVKSRANVLRQIGMILVSAPAEQREELQKLHEKPLLDRLRRSRPADPLTGVGHATATALRQLARRHEHLTTEIGENTDQLRTLVEHPNPGLLAAKGVGVVTATQLLITVGDNTERITSKAAFAALTGVSPIPASSGKTNRHRLNRGGDRRANNAIHTIALVRMSIDPRSKAYITKKTAEGKTKLEAIRCLKRHIANELFILSPTREWTRDRRAGTRLGYGASVWRACGGRRGGPSRHGPSSRSRRVTAPRVTFRDARRTPVPARRPGSGDPLDELRVIGRSLDRSAHGDLPVNDSTHRIRRVGAAPRSMTGAALWCRCPSPGIFGVVRALRRRGSPRWHRTVGTTKPPDQWGGGLRGLRRRCPRLPRTVRD